MSNRISPFSPLDISSPSPFQPQSFDDPAKAVDALTELYDRNTAFLIDSFSKLAKGVPITARYRAFYPQVSIETTSFGHVDSRLSYGHVTAPGVYTTTITRPQLFRHYLKEQLALLMRSHNVPVVVSESTTPIPLHFAFGEGAHVEASAAAFDDIPLRDLFDTPDLNTTDDEIANGEYIPPPGQPSPLAPFTAQRIDYSLARLAHYTATSASHFQNFVLFTNYQFYIDEFCNWARDLMAKGGGDGYTRLCRARQYHHARPVPASRRDRDSAAAAANAGLPSEKEGPRRHHHDQYRRRPVQRQDDHRPRRGAAPACLADARPLRRPAQQPAAR